MKNRNNQLTAVLFVVALVLAPIIQAAPAPDGGPTDSVANDWPRPDHPIVTIHSTDNVVRGETGSFVVMATYGPLSVNFTVSGSAVAGVDYVPLGQGWGFWCSIGQSGYGTILIKTLPNPRGPFDRQAYSVVVTLEPGPGYFVGTPSSATMWIKP
jgi:hypothetical protein